MVIRRAGISTTADTSSQPAALSVSISHYKDRLVVVDPACPRDSTRSVLAPVWAPGLHVTISANGLCVSVSSAMISAQSPAFLGGDSESRFLGFGMRYRRVPTYRLLSNYS